MVCVWLRLMQWMEQDWLRPCAAGCDVGLIMMCALASRGGNTFALGRARALGELVGMAIDMTW